MSLGFFDDIYVPVPLLPSPNHSEPDPEQKWASLLLRDFFEIISLRVWAFAMSEMIFCHIHNHALICFISFRRDGIRWIWEYEGENYPIDGTDEVSVLHFDFVHSNISIIWHLWCNLIEQLLYLNADKVQSSQNKLSTYTFRASQKKNWSQRVWSKRVGAKNFEVIRPYGGHCKPVFCNLSVIYSSFWFP